MINSKSFDYVKNELNRYKEERQLLLDSKRSITFEISAIKKKITSLEKNSDHTGDVFHSGNYIQNLHNTNNLLNDNIEALNFDIAHIDEKISELEKIITDLENIIKEDENNFYSNNKSCDSSADCNSELTNSENIKPLDLIDLCELDRARISRDIHDSVVQSLTALIHKQDFIGKLVDNDLHRAKEEINITKSNLRICVEELRNIIFDLKPIMLEDLGFEATFNYFCHNLNSGANITYEYSLESDIKDYSCIPYAIQITVFRIIRELSSNSEKHAECSNIRFVVSFKKNVVIINYSDDGKGFDFDNCSSEHVHTGYGILMLKERVALLNGTIKYSNLKGSSFEIYIPY